MTLFIVGGAHVSVIDFSDVIYSFAIGSVGAIMFLLVDKYEPEGPACSYTEVCGAVRMSVRSCTNCSHTGLGCFSRSKRGCIPGVPRSGSAPSA